MFVFLEHLLQAYMKQEGLSRQCFSLQKHAVDTYWTFFFNEIMFC